MGEPLNVLELFSGACGGWHLGLAQAGGFRVVAACEADPWRRAVYRRLYPGVPVYPDVCLLTAERMRADGVPAIDVVVGSPPCQDASTANTSGKGVEGERTGLFFEFVRLVRELQPAWIAAENVPGIRRRGVDRVLDALERENYALWPLVVGAADLGAPHLRKRLWILGAHAATVQRLEEPGNQPNRDRAGSEPAPADASERRFGERINDLQPGQSDIEGSASANGEGGARRSGPDLAQSELKVRRRRTSTDRSRDGRRQGQAWRSDRHAAEQAEQAQWGTAAVPHSDGESGCAVDGEVERELGEFEQGVACDAFGAGLEGLESVIGDDGAELTALERAIAERCGSRAANWNGGIVGRLGVDDGIPKGASRPLLAAYGDAVIPQIPTLIGRAIMQAEGR